MPLDPIQHAAEEQFSRQSHRYAKGHVLEDVTDVRDALSGIALPMHARVLDIAAGAGHTGLYLASLGHTVTLSDISDAMLARVREAAAARALTVETRCHTAEQLPYESASFDLATCRVAAHHFSGVSAFVHEVARVLKPGGWFLLIDGSVEDGQPVAEEWLHRVEKLRDPSHVRFITPGKWTELCGAAGLRVKSAQLSPMKQPDLNWYFETAATTEENRRKVLELVASAPSEARALFKLGDEQGKIVWWWQRLALTAQRPSS